VVPVTTTLPPARSDGPTWDEGPARVGSDRGGSARVGSARVGAARVGSALGVGALLVGLGVALLPWLAVLATTLPATATVQHWWLAWVGLDCLEAVGLISTGLLLRRGDPRRCLTAVATAVLLLCDAWFDTTTSAPGADFATAVAMAVLVELPLAWLCARLALRALPRG
jgi:hypothetical protein